MNRIQKKYKKEAGFTLIEVMVVLAILAIISVITIVSIRRAKDNVDDKGLMQDFNELKVGLDQYRATCKTYPNILSASANNSLSTAGTGCVNTLGETMSHLSQIDLSKYVYIALARNTSPSYCSGYWLAVKLDPSNGLLLQDGNFTPTEMGSFLLSQNGIVGGWVRCNGNTVQVPINAASAGNFYGEKSSGVN